MRFVSFKSLAAAGMLLAIPASAVDVSLFGVLKSKGFLQADTSPPVALASNGWAFQSFVFANTSNAVTNATVQAGGGTVQTLDLKPGGTNLLFVQIFNSQQEMEAVYPTGTFPLTTYTMTIYAVHDGTNSTGLTFGALFAGSYPPTPQVVNFDAAQDVDSTTDFTLTWNLAGGQSSDIVEVTVADAASNAVYASLPPGAPHALTGISNAVAIPGNLLPPGQTLTAHLIVGRPVGGNTNNAVNATGAAVLAADVQFPMVTRPAPLPPQLTILSGRSFPFRLQFTGETNRNYHIQYATNLTAWQDLLVTNPVATSGSYTDPASTNTGRRFYRIKVGP